MNGFALLLVAAALGVDYGWQPSSDGRLEYIIQLEPVTLIALRDGQEVVSQIDPYIKEVRRFRIRVGTDMVPRVGTPTAAPQQAGSRPWTPPAGVSYGWQPVDAQRLEFIVQLSPERVVLLKGGEEIVGEIPAEVGNVSRILIRSAADPLPRQSLAAFNGAASYEAPTNGDPSDAGPQPTEAGTDTGGARQRSGAFPADNASGGGQREMRPGGGNTRENTTPPETRPFNYGPPRRTQQSTSETSPPAETYSRDGDTRSQSREVLPPETPPAGRPAQANPTLPPDDPRRAYPSNTDQSRWSGESGSRVNPGSAQGNAWQQQPVQPDNSAGWANTTENAQNWPSAAYPPVQSTGQASSGAQSGWDPRLAPSNTYSGTQFSGGTPPLQSTDSTIPPARPTYSPFAQSGQQPAGNGGYASSSTAGGTLPYGQVSPPVFQTSTQYAGNPGQGGRQVLAGSGSDMVSIVSLSEKPRKKASPMDFWTSLAETASDPDLAFLRDSGQASGAEEAWWPLTLAMLALFASMGGNLYMGWIAVDVYRRYLDVAADEYEDDESSQSDDDGDEDWDRQRRRRREPLTGSGRRRAVA